MSKNLFCIFISLLLDSKGACIPDRFQVPQSWIGSPSIWYNPWTLWFVGDEVICSVTSLQGRTQSPCCDVLLYIVDLTLVREWALLCKDELVVSASYSFCFLNSQASWTLNSCFLWSASASVLRALTPWPCSSSCLWFCYLSMGPTGLLNHCLLYVGCRLNHSQPYLPSSSWLLLVLQYIEVTHFKS